VDCDDELGALDFAPSVELSVLLGVVGVVVVVTLPAAAPAPSPLAGAGVDGAGTLTLVSPTDTLINGAGEDELDVCVPPPTDTPIKGAFEEDEEELEG
jgi:hypothetical protein